VTISWTDGQAIQALGSPRAFTWTAERVSLANPTAGFVSDFSSWGPDAEIGLKPDVVAPGGFIYSTWPGGHQLLSGTSMAAPQVAGAAALYLEAHAGAPPRLVREALQDTASPVLLTPTIADSTHHEGGGLIQVDSAVLAPVVAEPSKLSFGEGDGGTRAVTLVNSSDASVTYTVSNLAAAITGPNTFAVVRAGLVSSATFSAPAVTVPAHGSASVSITATPNAAAPPNTLYGGYVVLTPVGGGVTLRVPYIGFNGDYQSIVALKDGGCALPGLFKKGASASTSCAAAAPIAGYGAQPNGATYTMTGDDFPVLLYHLDHQVRTLRIQVLDAKTGQPVDRTYSDVDVEQYLPRSSTPTGFFSFTWDGKRSFQDRGRGKWHRKAVGDGRYRLKLSVLKALGDAANPADWESWVSPVITLARTGG
jgi:subtilisin family serine protease